MNTWLMAVRPKTLTAAVVPVLVGTALVQAQGRPVLWIYSLCALLGALFIQIGTNLFNDALDFKKGADREDRLGPTRVTQSGLISARHVGLAAIFSFVLAAACGVPLIMQGGWPLLAIGLVSLLLGYLYTGGPFPLAYHGLGDLFVILFFGLVAVATTSYLHLLDWPLDGLWAGLQVGCLATTLIAINNTRDMFQDARANKRTLAVRFGLRFSRMEISVLFALSYLLQGAWLLKTWWWAFALPFVTLPLAISLLKEIWRTEPGVAYNRFLARAAQVHLFFGLLLVLGLWLS